MPIPTPRKNESKSEYVTRFMADPVMKREYPDEKQRLAIAYSTWQKSNQKMEPLNFNYQVPISIVESVMLTEQPVSDNINSFIIQGTAINAITSANGHKFLAEELRLASGSLAGVPLLVDHKNEIDAIKGRVLEGVFDSDKIIFKAKVIDKLMQDMIKDGRIDSVSIGASVKSMEPDNNDGSLIPHGITFREISLVAVGADPDAKFAQVSCKVGDDDITLSPFNTALKAKYDDDIKAQEVIQGLEMISNPTELDNNMVNETKTEEVMSKTDIAKMISDAVAEALKANAPVIVEKKNPENSEELIEITGAKYSISTGFGSLKGGAYTLIRG